MIRIGDIVAGEAFQAALGRARGGRPLLLARGGVGEIGGDDERVAAILEGCLRDIGDASGMAVSHASFFIAPERVTTVVRLDLGVVESDVAVYHDTLTETVEYQMLHRATVNVSFGSHTLALIVSGPAPDRILDLTYGPAAADAVRERLASLGLRMTPADGEEMDYETYAFGLEPDGA